jgi:hypothetical protein
MRSAYLLLTVVACGGGSNAKPDAPAIVDAPVDVAVDAGNTVTGTWVDTYYPASGAPMTMAACASTPVAVVVDPQQGFTKTYTGSCKGNGDFTIPIPATVSDFYIRAAGTLYATTALSGIALGTDHLGRNDATGINGVELSFDLTGMASWAVGDLVMAWAQNLGYYQSLVFDTNAPAAGDTTLTATAPWFGDAVDQSKSDQLQIFQLGKHTSASSLGYVTIDRAYNVASFTMAGNTTAHIPPTGSDAFTTPTNGLLQVTIDVPSWDQFASVAVPSIAARTIAATCFASITPDVVPSPPLFSYSQDSSSLSTINFGTISFADPFPSTWARRVKIAESFATTYDFNGATGTLNAQVAEVVSISDAEQGTQSAVVGPPTNVKFDASDALTETFINQAPLVSWSPPTVGTPTDYEITVYEARANGSTLTFMQSFRIITKQTQVRIPMGYLLGQRQYVFRVTAHQRVGVDVALTPQKAGVRTYSADMLSHLVTTNF